MKECGLLVPLSILDNKYGIGTLGKCAFDLIDFLCESKQKYLQILPLGQTGFGDSPYQTFSFYAGSVYYIDLEFLIEEGLLEYDDIETHDTKSVDYNYLYNTRFSILKKAFSRFNKTTIYYEFISENDWLEDYALFMSLKEVFDCPWYELPLNYKYREKNSIEDFKETYIELIDFYIFTQYLFFEQWNSFKDYANKKSVYIIGDMQMYASYDSVDVWVDPSNYQLDSHLIPKYVAGCPSDEFCLDGQCWGNPLYDWDYIKTNSFSLFKNKFDFNLKMFDKVRLDHFRGYSSYFKIKNGCDACSGEWEKAYGKELFTYLNLNVERIIVEDLGFITNDVVELVNYTKFPKMKVAVFGLDRDSPHLPCNYDVDDVVYTTTHDNGPINGYISNLSNDSISFLNKYYSHNICFSMIKHLYKSKAKLVIVSIFDLLELGVESTFNIPGTLNNWNYRLKDYDTLDLKQKLINLVIKYNR